MKALVRSVSFDINNYNIFWGIKAALVRFPECTSVELCRGIQFIEIFSFHRNTFFSYLSVFIRELYVEYNGYVMLSLIFHIAILSVTFVYVIKLQRINQPIPDKPVSFADSDDGDAFN